MYEGFYYVNHCESFNLGLMYEIHLIFNLKFFAR